MLPQIWNLVHNVIWWRKHRVSQGGSNPNPKVFHQIQFEKLEELKSDMAQTAECQRKVFELGPVQLDYNGLPQAYG